jgi:serine kinase of HPr protein (carbohydrate metabolism regulator)
MTELSTDILHASCVVIGGRAVLLAGRSGSGKSDLALRLIDRGAQLLCDDYTQVTRRRDGRLIATPSPRIAGKMEVRGVGIVEMDHAAEAEIALYCDLEAPVERLPAASTRRLVGMDVPMAAVAPLEASAPLKVELLVKALGR